ncbi:MAG: endonuclease, partial [Gammaproteobacteria bacterium]
LLSLAYPAQSDDYNHIATEVFWNQLYDGGGWSLYCGYRFDPEGNSPDGFNIGIDHVYDTDQMMDYLQCDSRTQCYVQKKDAFIPMESDLHNLYPSWTDLTVYRANRVFGEVEGEDWRFDNCDFEWKSGVVEPRPISRGNIARSVFYMHKKYNLPVTPEMIKKLKNWNAEDLPSEQERIRNDRIEKLQGQRNQYIDNPKLIDSIGTK